MPDHREPRKRLGDFEILRELGRGGMGIVYEARQLSLNRKVALKVLAGSLGLTPTAVVRFRREAEAAAKLHHTNIVPVYAIGEDDGTHYYAMEAIDGPSLNHVIAHLRRAAKSDAPSATRPASEQVVAADGPDRDDASTCPPDLPDWVEETVTAGPGARAATGRPALAPAVPVTESSTTVGSGEGRFDAAARMIAEVADALDYAHNQGVIHRDMKPSNLLLSPDGRLSINDFGLARMLEQPGMTMTGEFVGSPLYMSPEQITAGRVPLDHRTDIYSLGASLYQLLTLEPPYTGERRDQILGQILHKDPLPLRSHDKKIPIDLETICLKAMDKDPDRRYQTGKQLADDLRRYVNRHAISARRVGLAGRAVRWCRRNRALAAALAVALLLGVVASGMTWRAHVQQQRYEERLTEERRQRAMDDALAAAMNGQLEKAEAAIADAQLAGASVAWVRMLQGQVALFHGRPAEAIEHLEQAVKLQPDSVAARCMMASAYVADGQWFEFIRRVAELDDASPATAEDYLFKAQMLLWLAPADAIELLDRAVALRPTSPVCRIIRAQARAFLALDTGDSKMAERALAEAEAASDYLVGAPLGSWITLYTHLVCATLHEKAGQSPLAEQRLQEAEENVRHLEQYPEFGWSRFWRAHYYLLRNEPEFAVKIFEQDAELGTLGFSSLPYTASAFQTGRFASALATLDRIPEPRNAIVESCRALLLLEVPGGRDRAEAIYQALRGRGEQVAIGVALRLGRPDETKRIALDMLTTAPTTRHWSYQSYLHYLGGEIGATELLRLAGSSARDQARAHYYIGLRNLAEGERDTAQRQFKQSVETGVFHWGEVSISKAFLARMAQDPSWPNSTPSFTATQPASRPGTE